MTTACTEFDALISQIKQHVDAQLLHLLEDYESTAFRLKEAMQYSLLNGGKRMRPVLAFLLADLLDVNRSDVIHCAMAIECVHAYSLIHDDLPAMDNDDLRRGKPTNHIKYDEATAILAGDALQTLAFEILANCELSDYANSKRIELIKLLAQASGLKGMCAGQSIDLESTNQSISIETLTDMHELKTGALLKASILMPAALAPKINEQQISALAEFADKIGLAFQVQDDILDVISDSKTLGKPQGSDASLNKSTYVSHLGVEGAQEFLHKLHEQALQALDSLPYNTHTLKDFTDYLVNRTH